MKQVRCNLCGHDEPEEVYVTRDWRYQTSGAEWKVVRCRHCGFVYLNPIPDDLGDCYPKSFYYKEATAEQIRQATRELNGKKLDMLGELPSGRLLDIGCRTGEFADFMKQRGWDVQGLEVSPQEMQKFDVPIFYGTLDRAQFPADAFDLVTLWAVLEHIPNPKETIAEIARILKPGGRLVVLVPNFRSWVMGWLRGDDVPRHVVMFTPASYGQLMASAGLQLERTEFRTDWGGSIRGGFQYLIRRMLGHSPDTILLDMRNKERAGVVRSWPIAERIRRQHVGLLLNGLDYLITLVLDPILRMAGRSGTVVFHAVKPRSYKDTP